MTRVVSRSAGRPSHAGRGFTLVEVLVALSIMAVVATLTWRGIDGMVRARDISQAATDRTLRLGTAIAQWERDLQMVQPGMGVPALAFNGASLRLAREAEGGIQLVSWTVRDGALWRWASPPTTRAGELEEYWLRSQQLLGDEPGTLKVLDEVSAWQVYFYRGNGWSNPQSSSDRAPAPASQAPANPGNARAAAAELLPTGVRMQLNLPAGELSRDVLMSGQGY
jgi:general secretion pathway protein J